MKLKKSLASLSIRVLLVDDFEPYRHSVRSMLRADERLDLVGEAGDGLEAVQKSQNLQPDLILLDIGLPKLNGLEAAGRIEKVAPAAKVVFLSQNSDGDLVHAAMSNGARGYVLKADAGRELLPAIAAVVRGERFISPAVRA